MRGRDEVIKEDTNIAFDDDAVVFIILLFNNILGLGLG